MLKNHSNRRALLALLVVTVIWGWTFTWMKTAIVTATAVMGDQMPFIVGVFMTVRFLLAALMMPLLLPGARRGIRMWAVWSDGGVLAVILLGGFLLQMFALDEVDPAVSAFLTSLYVAFTAVIIALKDRRLPGGVALAGVALVSVGAAFISGPPQISFGNAEWLTVLCAVLFAAHIVMTDTVTRRSPPLAVAFTTFVWVGLGSAGLLCSQLAGPLGWESILLLLSQPDFLQPVLLASVLGTFVALSLLTNYQKHLDPVRAAILYSLEPVWAAIIAVSLGSAQLDHWLLFGGGLLLAGNLWMEVWPRLRAKIET
jgi:drug/metabolite transporter (DMT)-like permease